MLIEEALDEFLLQLDADGRSPHTRGQYRRHVTKLARWLRTGGHSGEIEDVTHQDLARFLTAPDARTSDHTGEPKKAASTNTLRTSIRGFFRYLHAAGYLSADPSRLVRRAVCSHAPPRALTEVEERRLLDALDQANDPADRRDRVLFRMMLATGLRIGSAVALDDEDVDLEAGELWVRVAKRDAPDRIPIDGPTRGLLREWIGDRTEGPLFPGANGRRITTRQASRRLARWFEFARIRRVRGCHVLRHTRAVRVYAATRDLLSVKRALRHRSIASTVVYAETP